MPSPHLLDRKIVILAAAALVALAGCSKKSEAPPPAPPPDVVVTEVIQKDMPIVAEWIGTTDGFVNADIRAQVTGYLKKQDYKEGQPVKKGDLLFEIDRDPFQANYDQVKANFDKAELDLKRETELLQTQAAAQQDLDNARQADLAAKAGLEQAQLNLNFCRITSPIDGIAGIATGQIGDLVGPSSGVLTTVSTLDPIKVYFTIPEQTYLDFSQQKPDQPHYPDGFELELILSDGSTYPLKGKIFATDRAVDPGTGTLRIAGVFPNPQYLLRPGQYARVRAVIRTEKGALLVPQQAVSELQGIFQVATVDSSNHAHLVNVKVGERVGPLWIVEDGLKPGDKVVSDGIQKVKEGIVVNPSSASAR